MKVSANGAPKRLKGMDALCKRYNVDVPMPADMGAVEPIDNADITASTSSSLIHCFEQAQIGQVGTKIFAGRLRDPNANYAPAVVRGTAGSFGLYDDYRRSESMIWDAVVSCTELVASAELKLVMPTRVRRSQLAELERFVEAQRQALQTFRCVDGGLVRFAEEAMSSIFCGFSTMERIHARVDGYYVLAGAQPRLQSTVQRWIMDADSDQLIGVEYLAPSGHNDRVSYTLPATGPNPWDNRILLHRIGGYGLDWEGCPPTRPSLHWVKFKRLLAQLVPASAEKYGVPITYIKHDPMFMGLLRDGVIDESMPDLQAAYDAFVDALAEDLPVHQFGSGIIAETIAPDGSPPTLQDWISYCDQMIAYPFSNEGNLLGLTSGAGSYAQAEVRERRFLRSAPFYHRMFVEPLNEQVLKPLVRAQVGDLLEYPRFELSTSRMSDNSQWITDARSLFGPNLPVEDWPQEFRDIAYEKMGITSPGALLDDEGSPEDAAQDMPDAPEEKVQDTALNGAQIASLMQIVQAVAARTLPANSAVQILMRAFQMSQEEAQSLLPPDDFVIDEVPNV